VAEFRAKGYLPEALVNYLALIGWSPGRIESGADEAAAAVGADELLPALELARRFRLEDVSHSAGVFDEDKLAWVNRHYLKSVSPARLADEALPFLTEGGIVTGALSPEGRTWLETFVPPIAASVDRLNQVPYRLHAVFGFDAAALQQTPELAAELREPAAREVVKALADDLKVAPALLDRDVFRAAVARIKAHTGQKGRALLHPIRLALTGLAEGPELDVIVPAIDRAAALAPESGLRSVMDCRARAEAVARVFPSP
jgi:glutamyl/glutaminyl-tRNA synthetase